MFSLEGKVVGRTRSEDDRRVITVDLTYAGRRRAKASREQHRRVFESVLGDLPPDQLAVGVDVLRRCSA